MMTPKQKTAPLLVTLIMGLFLGIPVGYHFYIQKKIHSSERSDRFARLPEFLWQTESGEYVGMHSTRGKVSLLAFISGEDQQEKWADILGEISTWADVEMKGKADIPFAFFLVTTQHTMNLPLHWQKVQLSAQDFATESKNFLQAQGLDPANAFLMLVDQNGDVRGQWSEELNMEAFKPLFAKLVFNHYLDEYLSKRTFFGVKRKFYN